MHCLNDLLVKLFGCSPEHSDLHNALTHSKRADSAAAEQSSAVSGRQRAASEPEATRAAASGINGSSNWSASTAGAKRSLQKATGYTLCGRSP